VIRWKTRPRLPLAVRGALIVLALHCAAARAHDMITAESAERYLAQAARHSAQIRSRESAEARAQAQYELGRMLDEIRDLLNRDVAAHGRIQGLPTEYLVRELARKGVALQPSPTLGRYPANVDYYRESLRLQPAGPRAADAMFAWLQGVFYDSFDADPLQPRAQSWRELQEQISLGERLLKQAPAHPELEEAKFILAVLHTRAARSAPDLKTGKGYADSAGMLIRDFQMRYPDSLRAAAMPVLLEALPRTTR
jgi:hypothetical protein